MGSLVVSFFLINLRYLKSSRYRFGVSGTMKYSVFLPALAYLPCTVLAAGPTTYFPDAAD